MKKILKISALPLLATLLVACTNGNEAPKEETTVAETTMIELESTEETTVEEESTTVEGETEGNDEGEDNGNEDVPAEDAVTFNVYVVGQEDPIVKVSIKDAAGLSVREAMEEAHIDFVFSDEEGVIVEIEGYENDYELGNTWTYLLNGEFAELGVVSQTLEDGDQVDWYYGTIDDIPMNLIVE